jgi:hypothetical protein
VELAVPQVPKVNNKADIVALRRVNHFKRLIQHVHRSPRKDFQIKSYVVGFSYVAKAFRFFAVSFRISGHDIPISPL